MAKEEKAVDRRLWVADLEGKLLGWLVSDDGDLLYLQILMGGTERTVRTAYYLSTGEDNEGVLMNEDNNKDVIEIQWASPPTE